MFEYHVHNLNRRDEREFTDLLNKHAREGWRLHTCTESTYGHMLLIFERPKDGGRQLHDYHGPG